MLFVSIFVLVPQTSLESWWEVSKISENLCQLFVILVLALLKANEYEYASHLI